MRKYNGKQIGLIIGSLVIAFVINWILWLIFMKHPDEINAAYQALLTICIGSAFFIVGDKVFKTEIFR